MKAGWNYRIVRHRDPLPKWMMLKKNKAYREEHYPEGWIEWFAIHEAFYHGKKLSITEDPIKVITDTFSKKEFNMVLSRMRQALNRPVLDYKTCKEVKV